MKTSLLFPVLLLISIFSNAQNPSFKWAKSITPYFDTVGFSQNKCNSVAVDDNGNIYMTGTFNGKTDFDPGPNIQYVLPGTDNYDDTYLLKLDSMGNFLWVKSFTSNTNKVVSGIKVKLDALNNIIVVGSFRATTDFDPGPNVSYLTPPGGSGDVQAFIVKLDNNGNFIWAKQLGGSTSGDGASGVAIDSANNIYTIGTFNGVIDMDPGSAVFQILPVNGVNMFISKLDPNGNFVWAKAVGGTSSTISTPSVIGSDITYDKIGGIAICGKFLGIADFDPGSGTNNLTSTNGNKAFFYKLDVNGNFVWAKCFDYLHTDDNSYAYGIVADKSGNIYSTGFYYATYGDTIDFDPGVSTYLLKSKDASYFVLKLNANGNFGWAKNMGGNGTSGSSIALDDQDNIYTIGNMGVDTADFDPGSNVYMVYTGKNGDWTTDIFLHKLNNNGDFQWARSLYGPHAEVGTSIVIDKQNNVLAGGHFGDHVTLGTIWNIPDTVDFDPTPNVYNIASQNWTDIFILKWGQTSSGGPNTLVPFNINSGIAVYPNPSNGHYYFDSKEDATLMIYDMEGRTILSKKILSGLNKIDITDQASGVYIVKLIHDEVELVSRIIKE